MSEFKFQTKEHMIEDLMESVSKSRIDWEEMIKQLLSDDAINPTKKAHDETIEQLSSARRALGIVNRLKNKTLRKKHAGVVMGNMNRIRGKLKRLSNQLNTA